MALGSWKLGVDTTHMRVTHLGKFYPPVAGGMERVLQSLAEGERARGVDTACAGRGNRAADRAGVRQRRARHPCGVDAARGIRLVRACARVASGACRDRHPRAPRTESDGAPCLLPDAPPASADHLVPQRSAPAALALPSDLRAVPERAAPPRPADRRVVAGAAGARRAAAAACGPMRGHPVRSRHRRPRRRQPPLGERRAEPVERTHRPLRRAPRSLQRRRRPAARARARRRRGGRSSATDRCAATSSV